MQNFNVAVPFPSGACGSRRFRHLAVSPGGCHRSCCSVYSRLNYWIVFCGGEALSNPPALHGVEAPTEAVVTLAPTKFTFELESEPENVQDLKLIIQASAPQSNGVTRASSKAVQIGGVLEAVTEEYDIKEDHDNKHGAPNAVAPKIFMKYFFVNTNTGEKIRRNAHHSQTRRRRPSRRRVIFKPE